MYKRFVVREYKFNFLTSGGITFSAALHQIKDTPKTLLKATSLFMKLGGRLGPQTKFSALASLFPRAYNIICVRVYKRAHQTAVAAAGEANYPLLKFENIAFHEGSCRAAYWISAFALAQDLQPCAFCWQMPFLSLIFYTRKKVPHLIFLIKKLHYIV